MTNKELIHELLMDLNRGRRAVSEIELQMHGLLTAYTEYLESRGFTDSDWRTECDSVKDFLKSGLKCYKSYLLKSKI